MLTLVIPVFNEEHHIRGCLNAVVAQTVMPDEVIVVDNNCTDRTIEIARTFPFVTVIEEHDQGRGHARSAGFNAAKHEIIGRIDADAKINPDWVEKVTEYFESDEQLVGLTGMGRLSFLPIINSVKTKLLSRAYYWFVHMGFRTVTMWGATMAIRKSAWNSVKDDVCMDDEIVHEDQDLSLWIAASGGLILQKDDVEMTSSSDTYRYLPKLLAYARLYRSTKRLHRDNGNLSSSKVHKLPLIPLLPGFFALVAIYIVFMGVSVLLFPLDYVMVHSKYKNSWRR